MAVFYLGAEPGAGRRPPCPTCPSLVNAAATETLRSEETAAAGVTA